MNPPNPPQTGVSPFTHFNYQHYHRNIPSSTPSQLSGTSSQHGRSFTISPDSQENVPIDPNLQVISSQAHQHTQQRPPRPTITTVFQDPYRGQRNSGPSSEPYSSPASSFFSDEPNPFRAETVQAQEVKISKMSQEMELLRYQLQEEQMKNKTKSTKAGKVGSINSTDSEGKLHIRHISQAFCFSEHLWVNAPHDTLAMTQLPTDYDPSTRLNANPDNPVTHNLHHLKYDLKQHLKDGEQEYANSKQMLKSMYSIQNNFRSELQNKVRANAGALLKEYTALTKDDIENIAKHDYRSNCTRFQDLLGYNPSPTELHPTYPLIPPILSREGTGTLNDLFRNPIHRKIIAMVLLGPGRMDQTNGKVSSKCRADQWHIRAVTPGMICAAGILAQWMISPDPIFTGKGSVTGIDYMARYYEYKRLLSTNRDHPAVISLINNLNADLFGVIPTTSIVQPAANTRAPAADASMTRLLQSFQDEMSEDNEAHSQGTPVDEGSGVEVDDFADTPTPPLMVNFARSAAATDRSITVNISTPSTSAAPSSISPTMSSALSSVVSNEVMGTVLSGSSNTTSDTRYNNQTNQAPSVPAQVLTPEAAPDTISSVALVALPMDIDPPASSLNGIPEPSNGLDLLAEASTLTPNLLPPAATSTGRGFRKRANISLEESPEPDELVSGRSVKQKAPKRQRTNNGRSGAATGREGGAASAAAKPKPRK